MSRKNDKKAKMLNDLSQNLTLIVEEKKLINFNFKYYVHGNNSGQSFQEWNDEGILVELNDKLFNCSQSSRLELKPKILEEYKNYPSDSKFERPTCLHSNNVIWARIRLTGKRRLIGFFLKGYTEDINTFYVVFLDKEHEFAPYTK